MAKISFKTAISSFAHIKRKPTVSANCSFICRVTMTPLTTRESYNEIGDCIFFVKFHDQGNLSNNKY